MNIDENRSGFVSLRWVSLMQERLRCLEELEETNFEQVDAAAQPRPDRLRRCRFGRKLHIPYRQVRSQEQKRRSSRRTLRGSFSPPDFGGLTRGIPKQASLRHSSPSKAQPLSRRFPISEEARSDCSRRRLLSGVSTGSANVGELGTSDTSVAGVEDRDTGLLWDSDEILVKLGELEG